METPQKNKAITVSVKVEAPLAKVWDTWTKPQHIVNWNAASADWHTPHAINPLKEGEKFIWRMEARDGSFGFDFEGLFTSIAPLKHIAYTLTDNRKVIVTFESMGNATLVTEKFETEDDNPAELQRQGWQAILNNFKQYTENLE